MSTKPFGQLIDAWAQPALTNLLQHVPEGERLLRASRSPLLERTMDPDQTTPPPTSRRTTPSRCSGS
jgi:hypothetical protein